MAEEVEETAEDLEERFQKECEDLLGSINQTTEPADEQMNMLQQPLPEGLMDDNDTVYVNSGGGSREQLVLLESRSMGLNVDLADIRASRETNVDSGGDKMANLYDDDALVSRMNTSW